MSKLQLYPAADVTDLEWPVDDRSLNLDSPALDFFTDFRKVKPLVMDNVSLTALEARNFMQHAHVRLKIVLDRDDHFVGVLSADDLSDDHLLQKSSKSIHRDELLLDEFIIPKKDLACLHYSDIENQPISSVVDVLKDNGLRHCLVVDDQSNKICGLFSASDISRKLKLAIDISKPLSFFEVFNVVKEHHM